ncbi:MAG: DUF998 domain-containing protein [Hyphomicrobiaceae bacterium]|nr:DUF998 domain-containing protein [Hyphomicrobiaceae bacterium]MCC0023460.1 DUF998 domain-containing protein [Hyphomicrobiaceae bacterium]
MRHLGLWAGIAAPLLYLVLVVTGGAIAPGYDHVRDPISALIADQAPFAAPLNAGFLLYNLLFVVFAVALALTSKSRMSRAASLVLLAVALAGAVMIGFPMDAANAGMSATGLTHILLAIVQSIGSMVGIGMFAGAFWRAKRTISGTVSIAALLVVFLSGGLAAAAGAQGSPVVGLLERITIGTFEIWLFLLAFVTLRDESAV